MITRSKKLEALYNFTVMAGQNPMFAYLLGYLAGQVDRVSFLADLKGADVAIRISVKRATIWPADPFKATVRGVSMPNPFTLVKALNQDNAPISVSLDFDGAEDAPWYQEVLLPNASYIKDAAQAAQEDSERLRKEMDRTLDIYRECKSLLKDSDPDKQRELSFYMRLAEDQLKRLSNELGELNRKMKEVFES